MVKVRQPERHRDTLKDYLRRRDTPGTLDYACELWRRSEDKHGLPDPLEAWFWAADSIREREPLAEVLTPALARKLGRMKSLRDDLLVVNANITGRQFQRLRREALEEAGMKLAPRKPPATARLADAELSLALLYEHVLDGARPSELIPRVWRGRVTALRHKRGAYQRIVAEVQSLIESARQFLRQHGCQLS